MEINIASPPFPTPASRFAVAPAQIEPLCAEVEYGCVDWYPYVDGPESRDDWLEDDRDPVLAVA
jgi:hypothetical protein